MKKFSKIVALGAVLAAASPLALADSIGQISAAGGNTFTSSTITFTGPFINTGDFGIFSPLSGGSISFVSGPLNYSAASPFPAPVYIFTVTNGSASASFYAQGDTYTITPYTDPTTGASDISLLLNGSGYFTGSFFSGEIPGSFTVTTQGEPGPNGDGVQVTFSGTGTAMATTPEPNSLVLLGTGLVGAAGMLFTRRRNAADIA